MRRSILLCFIFYAKVVLAQDLVITGRILNERGEVLEDVNIQAENSPLIIKSNKEGIYLLAIDKPVYPLKISYKLTGYFTQIAQISYQSTPKINQNITLKFDITELDAVTVSSEASRHGNLQNIDAGLIKNNPSASQNFESLLKTLAGVSTNNELSSQYSVRGGSFDENLIYINDIEIFRPLLIRNAQQEGLSFINPELVSKAVFSAGGFEARYGDKLSSVLDIRYGKPDSSELLFSAGLLGLSATAKVPYKKSYLLAGIRNKTNQSILRTQPVVGSYEPQFYDIQALYYLDLNKRLAISVFGDYNLDRFSLVPQSRETVFGTVNQQYRLRINYQGQEKDRYESIVGALTLAYKTSRRLRLKWINSAFKISEHETFDLKGSYVFDELITGYNDFENVRAKRGIGTNYDYARNTLKTSIYSSELRSSYQTSNSFWESGIRYQIDVISDRLNEYKVIDSAGYTLPNTAGNLNLSDVVYANNYLTTSRLTAFIQNTFPLTSTLTLAAGLRSNYNSYTKEFFLSPRFSAIYRPAESTRVWRFSAGSYNQPPFYRELRNFNGELNDHSKSQRSIHLLAATDYTFQKKDITTKFTSELYLKKLNNLVPYKIENLRVRYFADQQAKGYVMGADFTLNSEFVSGMESSFRLSLMKAAEDIKDDSYEVKNAEGKISMVYPGYLRSPTDQRINFSAFFQDKLFNSPTYKVHLTILYGSSLPVGPPQSERFMDNFKIPAYRRVDIGFSKDFLEGETKKRLKFLNRYFDSFLAYAEVFNLLNINNTVSYLWIKDVHNNQFAIPNYLTSRQLNIKFIAKIKN